MTINNFRSVQIMMLRYLEMEFQRRDLLKTLQLEGDVVPLNPLPGRCPGPDPQKILGFGYPLLEALRLNVTFLKTFYVTRWFSTKYKFIEQAVRQAIT